MSKKYIVFIVVVVALHCGKVYAQLSTRYDTMKLVRLHFTQSKFINNIFHQAINSIRKDGEEIADYLNVKSEDIFLPYEDKIIRKIYVRTFNFDRSFYDTTTKDNRLVARLGKRLHYITRDFVIKDNLFIKENTKLNAYKLADNERYLRTLEYIQDARILVTTIGDKPDSVDIYIFTKDFFSIAGGISSELLNHIDGTLYETNLGGMAQKLEFTGLYDYNRSPALGIGALYRKGNLFHTFIDATIGYSTVNGSDYTGEEETISFFALSKRLVSPYTRTAGGLILSRNSAANVYKEPASLFYKYSYDLFDAWAGYSIGIRQLTASNNTIRDRRFLAFRYMNRDFKEVPTQIDTNFSPVYNSSQLALAQITFYRQDYYKTQYIYGFGTTEDMPYGYNITLAAGLHKQLHIQRPYAGVTLTQYKASLRGDFLKLYFKSGGFLYNNKIQDGSFLIGASAFSRLFFWHRTRVRSFATASFTQLYNRVTYKPLRVNNSYGLRGFLSDSAYGTKRLSLQLETEFYLKQQIFGFRFAPFPYADFALITPENKPYSKSVLYTSLGGGLRARNPNLVFETIEVRAYFFPGGPANMSGFKIITTSNIKFRYSSNYVNPPDVVQLNTE